VITGHPNSPIGKVADFVLSTGNPKEVEPMNLVPTTSCVAMLVIGDILTVLSMKKLKLTPSKYQKHHHGGYIGKQAKKLTKKN
jgi:arabinose-5-phosphate isomerase